MRIISSEQLNVAGRWRCAMTGRESDPRGFIDSSRDLTVMGTDNQPRELHYRAAVSFAAVEEMARMIGWVSPSDIDDLQGKVDDMGLQLAEAQEQLAKIGELEKLTAELGVGA